HFNLPIWIRYFSNNLTFFNRIPQFNGWNEYSGYLCADPRAFFYHQGRLGRRSLINHTEVLQKPACTRNSLIHSKIIQAHGFPSLVHQDGLLLFKGFLSKGFVDIGRVDDEGRSKGFCQLQTFFVFEVNPYLGIIGEHSPPSVDIDTIIDIGDDLRGDDMGNLGSKRSSIASGKASVKVSSVGECS